MDRTTFMEMFGTAKTMTGQIEFTTAGTYTVIVDANTTSISVVLVQGADGGGSTAPSSTGGGYGGKGGNLRYKNAIPVTPGEALTVVVGRGGFGTSTSKGGTGVHTTIKRGSVTIFSSAWAINPGVAGDYADGGGDGGDGGAPSYVSGSSGSVNNGGGGGGAGGYGGKGGNGAKGGVSSPVPATSGTGGAGGGGGASPVYGDNSAGQAGAAGGGVGLRGQGANGAAGSSASPPTAGKKGSPETPGLVSPTVGGGGRGGTNVNVSGSTGIVPGLDGTDGGARIIWPGDLRQYPSTRTADE